MAYVTNDTVTGNIDDLNDLIHSNLDDMKTYLSNTASVSGFYPLFSFTETNQ